MTSAPSLSTWQTIGLFAKGGTELVERLRRAQAEHGDLFRLKIPFAPPAFVIMHPDELQRILITDHRAYIKSMPQRELGVFLGDSVLIADGEVWRQRRKRVTPFFLRRAVESYGEIMAAQARALVDEWSDGELRDVSEDMSELTLKILGPCLFGDVPIDRPAMTESLDQLINYMRLPRSVRWLPTPGNRASRRSIERIQQAVDEMVALRRAQLEASPEAQDLDLISVLLHTRDDAGNELDAEELRGELITFVLAGHETTALALIYSLYLLAIHPEQAQRAHDEVDRVLEGRPPTLADVDALAFVKGVFDESMRLYPPVFGLAREASEDTELRGVSIPAGAQVLAVTWAMHRDARFFPDPVAFMPERWSDEAFRASLPKCAYTPFGAGPRVCTGARFAVAESVIILATILQRFTLEWPREDKTLALRPSFSLRAAEPVRVVLGAR